MVFALSPAQVWLPLVVADTTSVLAWPVAVKPVAVNASPSYTFVAPSAVMVRLALVIVSVTLNTGV